MRDANGASDAAERASRLVTEQTPRRDALLVAAVLAEARRDPAAAEARYRDLVTAFPDEPAYLLELAGFQDRQGQNTAAITTLQEALMQDGGLARADLDLCRLYNRVNDPARAKQHARDALGRFGKLGARGGEAQTLFCLTDALRVGTPLRRPRRCGMPRRRSRSFNGSHTPITWRARYYYVALVAGAQGNRVDAGAFGEKALAAARQAGNVVLQPLMLMNLGVTHSALGEPSRAAAYYEQSAQLYESLGDGPRAAQLEANAGALRVDYGPDPDAGAASREERARRLSKARRPELRGVRGAGHRGPSSRRWEACGSRARVEPGAGHREGTEPR